MNEVAQGPPLAQREEGLLVVVAVGFTFDGDGEGPLSKECLMAGRHFPQIVHHHKHLHHRLIGVE